MIDLFGGISAFAGYSNSFQPQQGVLSSGANPDALEATTVEAGLKGTFFGGKLQATASVYETKRKNLLKADPNDPTFTVVSPIGDVRVKGVEFEISGQLTQDLEVQGGFALMESEITKTTDPGDARPRVLQRAERPGRPARALRHQSLAAQRAEPRRRGGLRRESRR